MKPASDIIEKLFVEHASTIEEARAALSETILAAAKTIVATIENGGTVLICGNGGSAADAQHFAAELVGRFEVKDRRPLPAIALTTDSSALTSISNDFGYTFVFSRQVEALGRAGDLLIGFSTSGRSGNVLEALEAASKAGMACIGFTGADGSAFAPYCGEVLAVPSSRTARIQEVHILIIHALCELIDKHFSGELSLSR